MSSEKWTARNPKADAVRGDQGLILDSADSNNNKRMNLEDISRLQSTAHDYSNLLQYKVDDLVIFSGTFYRNTIAIITPETFNPTKWSPVNGFLNTVEVRVDADLPDALPAPFNEVFNDGDGKATFTTVAAHGYTNGQTVEIIGDVNSVYDGFFQIEVMNVDEFKITALTFSVDITGDTVRCIASNTAYILGTPVQTLHGYRKVPGSINIFESTNIGNNLIVMIGTGATFLTASDIGFMHFSNFFAFDGTGANTLFNVKGAGNFTNEGIFPRHSGFDNFDNLGTIDDTAVGPTFTSFTRFNTGFTLTNVNFSGSHQIIQPLGTATWLKINNVLANPLISAVFTALSAFGGPGTSMFDINPATPLSNKLTLTDSSDTFGGVYFKPSDSLPAITAFVQDITNFDIWNTTADNGFGGTTIFADGIVGTLDNGRLLDLNSIGINGLFTIFNVTATSFDIALVFPGASESGNWEEQRITATATAHGLSDGDGIVISGSPYDGPKLIFGVTANTYQFPGFFTIGGTGTMSNASLDGKSLNVRVNTVAPLVNSKAKGSMTLSAINIATTTLGVATFTNLDLNALAKETNDIERFELIDTSTGELEYTGLEPFSGELTASLFGTKVGGGANVDYIIRAVKNGLVMVDAIEIPFNTGTDPVAAPIIIPVSAVTGDTFQLQVSQAAGDDIIITALTLVIQ